MKFLEKEGFSADDLVEILNNIPDKLQAQIEENHKLVTMNIRFLKEIGVMNYQKIFIKFYDLFLMDPSNFEDIFAKYDTADLINKLNKNVNIVEYL